MPPGPRASSEAKKLMDSFRAQIAVMQSYEDAQLTERLKKSATARQEALTSAVSMSVIAAGLVLLLVLVSRRAGTRIRATESWLGTTLKSIGDGVIATDAAGVIRFLNPVAAELTGWSQSQAQGRAIEEVFRIVGVGSREPEESPVAQILRQATLTGRHGQAVLISPGASVEDIEVFTSITA